MTILRIALGLLLCLSLYGQNVVRQYPVASLPPAAQNANVVALAIDGASSSDCTNGHGVLAVWCQSDGNTWKAIPITLNAPQWIKAHISYTLLTSSGGNTATINLAALAPRQKVCGVSFYTTTAFTASALSALTVTVGDSADSATTYSAFPFSLTAIGQHDTSVLGSVSTTSTNVQAHFTSTGAALSALTAGASDIELCLVQLP